MKSTPNVTIRRGHAQDLADVQRLNQLLYDFESGQDFYAGTFDPDWTYSGNGSSYFARYLADTARAAIFVAEIEGRVVGYLAGAHYRYAARSKWLIAELENMFVEAEYRGQSIGHGLVEAFRGWAKTQGVNRLRVGAFTGNKEAQAFYQACGFTDFELILEQDV